MSVILKLIETHLGETPYDGKYLLQYDPSYHPAGTEYNDGIIEVTDDPRLAMRFPSALEALEKWKESYGMREDGRPNRPLTAWTVMVEEAPETEEAQ